MNAYFEEMLRRLRLTTNQRRNAKAKYDGVAKALHDEFYDTTYNGSTKLLIGSYGKRTNIRPPSDIDLLFKIPVEVYEQYLNYAGNGASALLQRVRSVIGKKYDTSELPRAWGKVVLIEFPEGRHSVELLPAYDVGGGVFQIPNSEDGGSFESFDVGADLAVVTESSLATNGLNRKLIRMIKRWRRLHKGMNLKPYQIESYVADYLRAVSFNDMDWSELVAGFFVWLSEAGVVDMLDKTYVVTAMNRAQKARQLEHVDDIKGASEEWGKIFGNMFPAYSAAKNIIFTESQRYPSPVEEFIEHEFPVKLNPAYEVKIQAAFAKQGWLSSTLDDFFRKYGNRLPKHAGLDFTAVTNVPGDARFYWKVRNFGQEAAAVRNGAGLRGQIKERGPRVHEDTLYSNNYHFVEVYVVKDGTVVAKESKLIPIGGE